MGAPSPSEHGLFYQWGSVVGHTVEDGYDFNSANYEAQGLNLITTDLDYAHDAARAYYGPKAKMPSSAQIQELIDNCNISAQGNGLLIITSRVNGSTISMRPGGIITGQNQVNRGELNTWSINLIPNNIPYARSLFASSSQMLLDSHTRIVGINIMAVHS